MSKLGDGKIHIKACGELHETFFRNKKPIKWRSVVCKELTAPFIGGTPCLKDNGIEQDFVKDVIHLHNRLETVQPTNPLAILPTVPTFKLHFFFIRTSKNQVKLKMFLGFFRVFKLDIKNVLKI